ncbi:MAG: hypothetical protein FWF01_03390 [Alphaproteobacteria bacterium]|nr:hypothetical protein [Alphaproteobacteria bacterium]
MKLYCVCWVFIVGILASVASCTVVGQEQSYDYDRDYAHYPDVVAFDGLGDFDDDYGHDDGAFEHRGLHGHHGPGRGGHVH